MKTLKIFLEKHNACKDGFKFAKDLTLEEFLETCPRGDWILWLFRKTNPESLRELTLTKAHCANTVRHLMTDKRSLNAVDVAMKFGEGKATRQELADAAVAANAVYDAAAAYAAAGALYAAYAADTALYAAYAADTALYAAGALYAAYAADTALYAAGALYAAYAAGAEKQNLKQTADICRKFLPIEIWDQSQF